MPPDFDAAYRAVQTRDPRFDGQFFTAVRTTKIYCRPACPSRTPLPHNVSFFPTAAAAQTAGYRPCRRCLPDAAPGSPEWNLRADTVGAAMRLIADGVVDREGIPGLAVRVGFTPRHLHRLLTSEVGASPLALARARRAHLARVLLTTTEMPIGDVAFAAGFSSIRQFNETVREVFGMDPTGLRSTRRGSGHTVTPTGALTVKIAVRPPFAASRLLDFLDAHAVPGVELVRSRSYARSLTLPAGEGTVRLDFPVDDDPRPVVAATLRLQQLSDLGAAVDRCRRLLDADADPTRIDDLLGGAPAFAPSVAALPGLRVPGAVSGAETLLRTILGQQVSVSAARTTLGRLTRLIDQRVDPALIDPEFALTHHFPSSPALAELVPAHIPGVVRRASTLIQTARAMADGELVVDAGRRTGDLVADLLARPGIGPWTAEYVAMRVLGDPDILLVGDLALRQGAAVLGLPEQPAALLAAAQSWRPFRSYAGMHLWLAARPALASKGIPG